MSYDFIVYVSEDNLPEAAQVSQELATQALELLVPESIDFRTARGYVAISDIGFEITRSSITSADIERYRNMLRDNGEPDDEFLAVLLSSDMQLTFRCRDAREIDTAKLVAGAIAKLSRGFICDPQRDVTVQADFLPQ